MREKMNTNKPQCHRITCYRQESVVTSMQIIITNIYSSEYIYTDTHALIKIYTYIAAYMHIHTVYHRGKKK